MIRYESEERDGVEIGFVILSRPEKRNALTPDAIGHLSDAAHEGAKTARSIAIIGEGPVFCAGFDLALCAEHPDGSVMRELLTGLSEAVRVLRRLDVPVIAGVHGGAIAGGAALLGGADLVVAERSAKIGYPVVRLGVSPAVSVPFLSCSVEPGGARAMTLDPGLISAADAHRRGLVHELVDGPAAVFERVRELAFLLALKPADAVSATKAWLNELDGTAADARAAWALDASLALTGSPDEQARLQKAVFGDE
ncbi:MAG: enoyl-CoA hydratase/isomerase family protein [Planctomycetota bacterium]